MNLAPVLDVNDNPDKRSSASALSAATLPWLRHWEPSRCRALSAGIAPVGKHYPGHGNTSVDSHLELPVLPHPMKRLAEVELKPFRAAIRKGLPAIMTAHIIFKAIDPHRPATLSEPVLQGLLRRDLGFQGLIMTDCMEMNAISEYFGTARGAVLALKAGADMVLISHTPELQREACEMLVEAVQTGEIPLSRLDEAVRRILSLKKALRIPNPLPPGAADTEEFSRLSAEAHRRSITILRDAGLPVGSNESSRIVIASSYPERALGEALREMGAQVVHLAYDSPAFSEMTAPGVTTSGATAPGTTTPGTTTPGTTTPGATAPGVTTRREELNQADTVIILTRNAWKNEKQAAWVRSILREKPGAVLVATGDPYDFRVFPDARAFVCTYSHRPEALRALAEALTGAVKAEGRLPVRL